MDIISGNPEENALAIEATGAIRQVIDFILDKDTFLIKQLRGSLSSDERADIIRQRQQLNDLLYVIEIYERFGLCQKDIEAIVALPPNRTDISEYRILDDCDVEDRAFWTELDGIRLKNGDILIKKK